MNILIIKQSYIIGDVRAYHTALRTNIHWIRRNDIFPRTHPLLTFTNIIFWNNEENPQPGANVASINWHTELRNSTNFWKIFSCLGYGLLHEVLCSYSETFSKNYRTFCNDNNNNKHRTEPIKYIYIYIINVIN